MPGDRFNIYMDVDLVRRLDELAELTTLNRSQLLSMASEIFLRAMEIGWDKCISNIELDRDIQRKLMLIQFAIETQNNHD